MSVMVPLLMRLGGLSWVVRQVVTNLLSFRWDVVFLSYVRSQKWNKAPPSNKTKAHFVDWQGDWKGWFSQPSLTGSLLTYVETVIIPALFGARPTA